MNLALSTCWNSWRHQDGRALIEEILDLGFDTIELSHGLRSSQLEGILAAWEKHRFTVSSVHNFLPMPIEVTTDSPDCYEFTSHRPKDRERALKLTQATVDWAAKLKAPFVVVHTGRIRSLNLTEPLRKMVEKGEVHSRKFVAKKIAAVRAREAVAEAHSRRVLALVQEAVAHAGKLGVRLGIENREYYEAVPLEREFESFLDSLGPHAGYWHDFGHAQIKHNLGLIDHREHLERMAPRLLGCHIHDTQPPFRDHRPPFTGSTPFDDLAPLIPPHAVRVLEMSPRAEKEQILAAAAEWKSRYP
jgi:sugar phosphate isomerase/epimerase